MKPTICALGCVADLFANVVDRQVFAIFLLLDDLILSYRLN